MSFTLVSGENILQNQLATLPASDPNSGYYVPPAGYYQNNSGQLVPNSTPSSTFSSPSASSSPSTPSTTSSDSSIWSTIGNSVLGVISGGTLGGVTAKNAGADTSKEKPVVDLEKYVFIIIGIILIAAGLSAFKQTQNVIDVGTRVARRAAELTA